MVRADMEIDKMTASLLKNLAIEVNNLAIRGTNLLELVLSMPEPAHVKDSANGKYIYSNNSNLEVYGLKNISQLIGKTIYDMDCFMKPYWGKDFAGAISGFDEKVYKSKKAITETNKIFIAKNGLVHVQDMSKIPILDKKGLVSAIFTHSHDKTDVIDLFELFDLYQSIYNKKFEVRKFFCKYLKIDSFFDELPSIAEIKLLLHAKNYKHRKNIADKTHTNIKTIETHITHINNKISQQSSSKSYVDVLEFIRISRGSGLNLSQR